MKINQRKLLIARMQGVSPKRVWINPALNKEVKDAITKEDLRNLMGQGIIKINQKKGVSRGRARHILHQKKKGQRKGHGSRKGRKMARGDNRKRNWINRVRSQRDLLTHYRTSKKIERKVFSELYRKIGGGFFRSRRHLALYIKDRNLFINKK